MIQTNYTEKELVYALKKHDNAAYRYLYMNYRGALYTTIQQVITETETANDLLQEVFVHIWKTLINMMTARAGCLPGC